MLFDNVTYEKLLKEVPAYRLITPSIVSERHKVRGSLARKALTELLNKGRQSSNFFLNKFNIVYDNYIKILTAIKKNLWH